VQRQRVFLHVGAPKTGTTFVQRILWDHRDRWAESGVAYPLHDPDEAFRAAVDVRGLPWGDATRPEWEGTWDLLAARARSCGSDVVISNELLCGADAETAKRVVASFGDADVHLVLTLRPLRAMLRSDWQEQVKHRHVEDWADYLHQVLDRPADTHLGRWFWSHHDAEAVLSRWAACVPPEQVHVVLTDPTAPARRLWEDLASLIGLPADVRPTSDRRSTNAALGRTATRLLAAVNERVADDFDDRRYADVVGAVLVGEALPAAIAADPVPLPEERLGQVDAHRLRVQAYLGEAGFDVVGDLHVLSVSDSRVVEPAAEPGIDTAADVVVALLHHVAGQADELHRVREEADARRREAEHLRSTLVPPGRLKRTVRSLSGRSRLVMRARVVWWHLVERLRGPAG